MATTLTKSAWRLILRPKRTGVPEQATALLLLLLLLLGLGLRLGLRLGLGECTKTTRCRLLGSLIEGTEPPRWLCWILPQPAESVTRARVCSICGSITK